MFFYPYQNPFSIAFYKKNKFYHLKVSRHPFEGREACGTAPDRDLEVVRYPEKLPDTILKVVRLAEPLPTVFWRS